MTPESPRNRPVRSFVRREGRITAAQERALTELYPRYGIDVSRPVAGRESLFGRRAPLELEIGCGNGDALTEMARQRPDHDFIGIEVYRPGVGRLLAGIESAGLTNVRVGMGDAVELLGGPLATLTMRRILVLFPDPWPKKRHHKRRLLQPPFVQLLAERLEDGGELVIATDSEDYAGFVMDAVCHEPLLVNPHGRGCFAPRPDCRPATKYERRGRRLGHAVFDIVAVHAS